MKEIKIKLKTIEEPKEMIGIVKDVSYIYSLDDSSGLIGMTLTMYNEIDPLEEFFRTIPDLYKYNIPIMYLVYYKNRKYKVSKTNGLLNVQSIKMY